MSDGDLPPALLEAFLRLCQGDFSFRLPRSRSRDAEDTGAFLFNTIAEELERMLRTSRDQEERLARAVETLTTSLQRAAAGDLGVQVERDYRGDAVDVLAFLVNNTVDELRRLVEENARRAAEERRRLEHLVEERTRQLRESEENFRRLFAAAPVPMLLVGTAEAKVRYCNERAAALLQRRVGEVVGGPAPSLFERDEDRAVFLDRLRRGEAIDGLAVPLRVDGPATWALVSARALVVGDQPSVMISLTDLTEQKRVEERLRELATTDALTGAHNRRHFFELAEAELARAGRYRHSLCVGMLDLDHFKAVNDRFGHQVGDEALQLVVAAARAQLRKPDVVGRYGGEEFALMLPETSLDDAAEVLERTRQAVEAIVLVSAGEQVHLTVSAGVVAWKVGERIDETLHRADDALYQAKQGRNRVVRAG
ncbi:MAG: sensor domain-containing diguanylate cyclase [Myxococcales bacterium]|nr:sensor domain-containing diguanylate cyclase [Myxococcales bacterium]